MAKWVLGVRLSVKEERKAKEKKMRERKWEEVEIKMMRANRNKIDCEKNKLKLQEKRCWEINRQR